MDCNVFNVPWSASYDTENSVLDGLQLFDMCFGGVEVYVNSGWIYDLNIRSLVVVVVVIEFLLASIGYSLK